MSNSFNLPPLTWNHGSSYCLCNPSLSQLAQIPLSPTLFHVSRGERRYLPLSFHTQPINSTAQAILGLIDVCISNVERPQNRPPLFMLPFGRFWDLKQFCRFGHPCCHNTIGQFESFWERLCQFSTAWTFHSNTSWVMGASMTYTSYWYWSDIKVPYLAVPVFIPSPALITHLTKEQHLSFAQMNGAPYLKG